MTVIVLLYALVGLISCIAFIAMLLFLVRAFMKKQGAKEKAKTAGLVWAGTLVVGLLILVASATLFKGAFPDLKPEARAGWGSNLIRDEATITAMEQACMAQMESQFGRSLPIVYEGSPALYEEDGKRILSGSVVHPKTRAIGDFDCIEYPSGQLRIEPSNGEEAESLERVFAGLDPYEEFSSSPVNSSAAPIDSPFDKSAEGYVDKNMLGDAWPFTFDSGMVNCGEPYGARAVTIEAPDGTIYAVNGMASSARQKYALDWRELDDSVWLDAPVEDPQYDFGLKVHVGPIIDIGLEMCEKL